MKNVVCALTWTVALCNKEDVMQNIYIDSDPAVMLGKPVIKGTRITVESILEKLSQGQAVDDILKAHPHLTREAFWPGFRAA
jgi:uncharacterized protein (DUF433 family)